MKKIINFTLIGLNLTSVLLIAQIDFSLFPLISSNFDIKKIERINNLTSNLSQGIIVITFFYLLLVYLPEKRRKITVRKLIQPRLDTVVFMMQKSVAYFFYRYNLKTIGDNFSGLLAENFDQINRIDNVKMNFNYKIKFTKNNYWTPFSSGDATETFKLDNERKVIKEKIDEILVLPIISSEDDLLIETLSQLRDSWFYKGVESYSRMGQKTTVRDFNKGLYDYYLYFSILSKFVLLPKIEINRN